MVKGKEGVTTWVTGAQKVVSLSEAEFTVWNRRIEGQQHCGRPQTMLESYNLILPATESH